LLCVLIDFSRYVADKKANSSRYEVLRDGQLHDLMSSEICAGDIVCIHKKQMFPADLVVLWSSNEDGLCFIETANLDGETNLKRRFAPRSTWELPGDPRAALSALRCTITCELPNVRLYHFEGRISVEGGRGGDDDVTSLSANNLLQRGAELRNTDRVFGQVVYAGTDTKLFKNLDAKVSKTGHLETRLNRTVMGLFCLKLVLLAVCSTASGVWHASIGRNLTYIQWPTPAIEVGFLHVLSYFVLFTYTIPISLFVTVEIVRLAQAVFMLWDDQMPDNTPRNSNANENLGLVQHIFSDKTGTLTRNIMRLVALHIDGAAFDEGAEDGGDNDPAIGKGDAGAGGRDNHNHNQGGSNHPRQQQRGGAGLFSDTDDYNNNHNNSNSKGKSRGSRTHHTNQSSAKATRNPSSTPIDVQQHGAGGSGGGGGGGDAVVRGPGATRAMSRGNAHVAARVDHFLRSMALCNTAVPDLEDTPGSVIYQADSPDEVALLQGAQANGFELYERRADTVVIREEGGPTTHRILATLEFTPDRKRMSVVYESPAGAPVLVCKGADSFIIERARARDPLLGQVQGAVDRYASEGLRTLVYAERTLDPAEFADWKRDYDEANASIVDREKRIHDICERLEVDLELLGCTAVEDRLQDNVPATLKYLFRAGIQLWLLTGDKQETAINIGKSSQLLLPEFELALVNATTSHEVSARLAEHTAHYDQHADQPFAVVIDGKSLEFALEHYPLRFISLGARAKSVIVCRATPLQKARVVKLAKEQLLVTALAVGDGSNDVAMIQEAEVGVGILGREGSQAARASDYAIAEFQDLRRLICVHGRYSYIRLAGLIQYSFYKNLAYILPQFYFAFFSGFSAQVFYDEWLLSMFNILFTSLPPLVYGFMEKDAPESIIDRYPEVYRGVQRADRYTVKTFLMWVISAVWHSVVIFMVCVGSGAGGLVAVTGSSGRIGGMWTQAVLASHIGVVTVTLRMALMIRTWTIVTHIAVWGSLLGYGLFNIIYTYWFWLQPDMFLVFTNTAVAPALALWFITGVALALAPDLAGIAYRRMTRPYDWEILLEIDKLGSGDAGHDGEVLVGSRAKAAAQLYGPV
jgi:phospholipid-translocating ATPase